MNIFEQAVKQKLRFNSSIGALSVEQLWDLPLTATGYKDSLDTIAIATKKALNDQGEESFVTNKPSALKGVLELQLDILKHIIAAKIKTRDEAEKRAGNAKERERLLEVLAQKRDESVKGLSEAEILKRIEELNA